MKNIGYPDTKNKLGGSSPLYMNKIRRMGTKKASGCWDDIVGSSCSPLQATDPDPDYKEGESMGQDDFEQMTGEDGDFHHGSLSQQASTIKKDKKGQYILSDSGYSDIPKDTIRPPSGSRFKKFRGKDVYNRKEQRNLYFPKK